MSKTQALTPQLVLSKTKADNIQSVRNLNLWGNELQDLTLLRQMPNLQVISLSVNKISSLKEFAYCQRLQELYLRKNMVRDIAEVKHLVKLPELRVLWLQDNPCSQIENYRLIVIHELPNLSKLDNNVITAEERAESKHVKPPIKQDPAKPNEPDPANSGILSAILILAKELSKPSLHSIHEHINSLISSKR